MNAFGDMDPEEFRREAHRVADWIADYFAVPDRFPVLSRVRPGEVRDALPHAAPERGDPVDEIFRDFDRFILPSITHWNHRGFFA
jgi:aromatic-L-amino-acid decarboxylase